MSHERPSIEISHVPELVRLAEEVRYADEDLAVLAPMDDTPATTTADAEALLARLHRNREARTHAAAPVPNTLHLLHRGRAGRTRHLRSR